MSVEVRRPDRPTCLPCLQSAWLRAGAHDGEMCARREGGEIVDVIDSPITPETLATLRARSRELPAPGATSGHDHDHAALLDHVAQQAVDAVRASASVAVDRLVEAGASPEEARLRIVAALGGDGT